MDSETKRSARIQTVRFSADAFRQGAARLSVLVIIASLVQSAKQSAAQESLIRLAESAAAPSPEASDSSQAIPVWIEQLSDDVYALRHSAAEKLLEAGASAREPLLALVDDPDPETRAAARRLVALIDRTEFQRRLDAFASDVDGGKGLTLPGWEQFSEIAGSDPPARALFVEMQRHEGAVLAAAFGVATKPVAQLWEERLMRIVQWQPMIDNRNASPPLGSCAAVLFLGTVKDVEGSDRGALLIEHLIQRPPLRDSLQVGKYRPVIRRLVVGWILHCPNENETLLGRRINLASINELKEALPLALAVVGGAEKYASVQPMTKAAALLLVGQFGSREHIDVVEPLLEDSTVCMPRVSQAPGQTANVQIRDVALVVLTTMTGQRPADYGYVHARMQAQQMYHLQTLHVATDEQRASAVAKWRAWRASDKGREQKESD
jgi:hypothetical protein